jgi:hypothetical protein
MPVQDAEEEAFKSKGYRDVDVFKVTQTLPVCKGMRKAHAWSQTHFSSSFDH